MESHDKRGVPLGTATIVAAVIAGIFTLAGIWLGRTTEQKSDALTPIAQIALAATEILPTHTPYPTSTPFPTYTPYPTFAPLSTYTPYPTSTAFSTYTPYPSSTPFPPLPTYTTYPTYTPYPTVTPVPSSTPAPRPTSTPISNTPPETILEVGNTWQQGDVDLILKNASLVNERAATGVSFDLYLVNRKAQDISLTYLLDMNVVAIDNRGNRLKIGNVSNTIFFDQCESQTVVVPAGKMTRINCNHYGSPMAVFDIGDTTITEIAITVSGISSINGARWRIPLFH